LVGQKIRKYSLRKIIFDTEDRKMENGKLRERVFFLCDGCTKYEKDGAPKKMTPA
jgi:hypothetical protein